MIKNKSKHYISIIILLLGLLALIYTVIILIDEDYLVEVESESVEDISLIFPNILGGDMSSKSYASLAYSKPNPMLSLEELRKFTSGDRLFSTNWVSSPSSLRSLDGLGPIFGLRSCAACHIRDGRGALPVAENKNIGAMAIAVFQEKDGLAIPHPTYGFLLQHSATFGNNPEASVFVKYKEIKGSFPDGEEYILYNPYYDIKGLNYGELENTKISVLNPTAVYGIGLIDAISEQDIIDNADPDDLNNDSISGRVSYVTNIITNQKQLARFGRKGEFPTTHIQTANAARLEMGLTSSVFPKEDITEYQKKLVKIFPEEEFDLSDKQLDLMLFYLKNLAVPNRNVKPTKSLARGEKIFIEIGCASCHRPKYITSSTYEDKFAGEYRRNQEIYPFTDLLLHDMGEELSDGRNLPNAQGNEWVTLPLWGIGKATKVNKDARFLHDGRARTIQEAILWHGGESETVKQRFMNLKKNDREALIEFINSL